VVLFSRIQKARSSLDSQEFRQAGVDVAAAEFLQIQLRFGSAFEIRIRNFENK